MTSMILLWVLLIIWFAVVLSDLLEKKPWLKTNVDYTDVSEKNVPIENSYISECCREPYKKAGNWNKCSWCAKFCSVILAK